MPMAASRPAAEASHENTMADVMRSIREISSLELTLANRCCRIALAKKGECSRLINNFDDCDHSEPPAERAAATARGVARGPARIVVEDTVNFDVLNQMQPLLFVCFCGTLRDPDARRDERWLADDKMCLEMTKMSPGVLCYISIPFKHDNPAGECKCDSVPAQCIWSPGWKVVPDAAITVHHIATR